MTDILSGLDLDTAVATPDDREATIAREIRILQSVEIQQANPSIIIGNIAMMTLIVLFNPSLMIASGAIYLFIPLALCVVNVWLSYRRLRKRERPKEVSLRRIRRLEIGAGLIGLVWAGISLLYLTKADPVQAMFMLMGTYLFSFATLVVTPSAPRASLIGSVPLIVANGFGPAYFGQLPVWLSLVLSACVLLIACLCARANWLKTNETVRLKVEHDIAEAERLRFMEAMSARLGKYLSPQLYQAIFSGRQSDEVASKRKKLTVFFSDIAGFTEITERLESEELTALLNRYLNEMSNIALAHGGTIDKFIGDAIVIYFGDPDTLGAKADADACVRMAIAMQARVAALKQEWLDLGLEDTFDLRIGINTGYCTVGNFGSDQRIDYTIIGNEVNLAARLETAAEVGGILLANETYGLVKDWINVEEAEPLKVKGFSRPVKTFAVRRPSNEVAAEGGALEWQSRHMSVQMNPGLMTERDRRKAADALRDALSRFDRGADATG